MTNEIDKRIVEWLLDGPPHVRYRTMLDVLHINGSDGLDIGHDELCI
jgi:hypothetical protein